MEYRHITKIAIFIIWIVFMMILVSFIGTLLTVPSTIANIGGVITIIVAIYITVWIFKQINKITKKDEKSN